MIPIVDAAVNPIYRGVIAVMGTQQGKTAGLLNICGRKLDDDPAPVLWIGPTKSNVQNVLEPQIEAMIENSPSLKYKRPPSKRRPKLLKIVNGVPFRLAWAGSATELASQPAHTVVVDERDKMKPLPGEGDVMVLAGARTSNYPDSVIIGTSSPTDGNVDITIHEVTGLEHWAVADADDLDSPIWKLWQLGTRFEFCWPCQHCGEYFAPRLRHLTGWVSGASPIQAKRRAVVACPHCRGTHQNSQKELMNARGKMIAPGQWVDAATGEVRGEPPEAEWATFWVSGLCSPWVSFGQRAHQWIAAVRSHDQETLRATVNTGFGELYRTRGEAPPWEDIKAKSDASPWKLGDIPSWAQLFFLTIDVQQDKLVAVTRGWGAEWGSILIDRTEIWGSTDEGQVWDKADKHLERELQPGVIIDAACVDSGYRKERAYDWAAKHSHRNVYASQGRDNPKKIYAPHDIETTRAGKRLWGGMKVWTLDAGYFKGWVHDRIKYPEDQNGAWRLPQNVGDDYCKQIVAEQRMKTAAGKTLWVKRSVNDYLDCEAMQVFLAHVEGVRNLIPPGEGDDDSSLGDIARRLNS